MERHDVLAMMTALKLVGMRAAYDDILADGLNSPLIKWLFPALTPR